MLNDSDYEFLKAHFNSYGNGVLRKFKSGNPAELTKLDSANLIKGLKKRLDTEPSKDMALSLGLVAFLIYCQEE